MKKIFICILAAIAVQVSAQTQDVSVVFDWCFPTFSTVYDNVCIEQGGTYTWFEYNIDVASCSAGDVIKKVHVSKNDCGEDETTTLQLTVTKCSPEGALPAVFTVGRNDDGSLRKVYFSKGNLQYRASDGNPNTLKHATATGEAQGIWRFAEHQYDFCGSRTNSNNYGNVSGIGGYQCDNSQASATYNNWIDIFHFGNTGCDGSSAPWQKSAAVTKTDLDANHDWGQFNAISNGGDEPGMWRVLSQAEWDYLINKRGGSETEAHKKIGGATIKEMNSKCYRGLVILPDNFVYPTSVTSTLSFSKSNLYSSNNYSLAQWEDMEKNGAVLIPANVARTGSSYYSSNESPWASYTMTSSWYSGTNCYILYFSNSQSPYSTYSWTKDQGCPVRLVADVQ